MKNSYIKSFAFLALCFGSNFASADWNGAGPIQTLYIYPTYVVAVQGPTSAGPAGCTDNGAWSFFWSDFSDAAQARILSTLLTAKTTGASINVVISGAGCGPEGKKRFNGMINLQ
jgi:hypothetical protein